MEELYAIAVVDSYHLQTTTPAETEVRNVRSFYSGHYKTHGVSIQGACDHHCPFVFLGVAGPDIMGDRDAIQQVDLHNVINGLPGLYCVIGDCACTPSEKWFLSTEVSVQQWLLGMTTQLLCFTALNRIEMSFGLMTNKWGIL